jgi:hypothetical protein
MAQPAMAASSWKSWRMRWTGMVVGPCARGLMRAFAQDDIVIRCQQVQLLK